MGTKDLESDLDIFVCQLLLFNKIPKTQWLKTIIC